MGPNIFGTADGGMAPLNAWVSPEGLISSGPLFLGFSRTFLRCQNSDARRKLLLVFRG